MESTKTELNTAQKKTKKQNATTSTSNKLSRYTQTNLKEISTKGVKITQWRAKDGNEKKVPLIRQTYCNFQVLPKDILLLLFVELYQSMDLISWLQLSLVCKHFNSLINQVCYNKLSTEYKWRVNYLRNHLPPSFHPESGYTSGSNYLKAQFTFARKSQNIWKNTRNYSMGTGPKGKSTLLSFENSHFIPKAKLYQNQLICSFGNVVHSWKSMTNKFGSSKNPRISNSRKYTIRSPHKKDITDFVLLEDGWIASSSVDRTVRIWSETTGYCHSVLLGHSESVHSIDANEKLIVSGGFDGTLKLWNRPIIQNEENVECSTSLLRTIDVTDRVWSVKCNRLHAVAGITGFKKKSVLSLFDIESGSLINSFQGHQKSVYDVELLGSCDILDQAGTKKSTTFTEKDSIIMSASYDCTVRFWQNKDCVLILDDPDAYPIYCAKFDGDWKVIAGTAYHSTVRCWDIRKPHSCLFTLFGEVKRTSKGVVNSLQTDDATIFVALSNGLYAMHYV
jgi:WD40 repeat protein